MTTHEGRPRRGLLIYRLRGDDALASAALDLLDPRFRGDDDAVGLSGAELLDPPSPG